MPKKTLNFSAFYLLITSIGVFLTRANLPSTIFTKMTHSKPCTNTHTHTDVNDANFGEPFK